MSQKEIAITASGPVGCGKSAILGEIELTLKSLGVPYRWADPEDVQAEKNLTHADWIAEIEATKPSVVLVEHHGPGKQAVEALIQEGVAAQRAGKSLKENPYLSVPDNLDWERAYYWIHGYAVAPAVLAELITNRLG